MNHSLGGGEFARDADRAVFDGTRLTSGTNMNVGAGSGAP